MGIAGIASNTTAAETVNHAKNRRTNGDFNKTVMECVSAGNHKVSLRQDALMSYASPQTGESVNIYRTDDYSENNPIYIIKGIDADGNEFEKEIDASKINPNNCSYNELMVLNVETGHTSPKDVIHAVAARDKANIKSYFDKKDYISYANEVMKDYKTLGNWGSYLSINNWIKSIMSYAFKMN
ncbi:MAG: hypothetical protein HDT40_04840 [Lachnospiraceae bacterium]|nr:hypothetical protein [Lachnospiraceae bacterium]